MMDRPEWIDTFPEALTAIATLTNNSAAASGTNPPDGPTRRSTGAANPRAAATAYGHIIRWTYDHDFTEPTFAWDIFALAGDPAVADARLDHRRRQVRLARRPLRRAERPAVDPDRRLDARRSTPAPTPASATTRCSAPTRSRGRPAGSWSARSSARSPACSSRPTRGRCSSASSTRARRRTSAHDPANPKQFSSWPDGAAGGRPVLACVVITQGRRRRHRLLSEAPEIPELCKHGYIRLGDTARPWPRAAG